MTLSFFNHFHIFNHKRTRFGPFVVGIVLGYLLFVVKSRPTKFKIHSGLNILLWIVSLFFMCLMIFGIYPNYNGHPLSLASNILYQATSRIVWALGLGYVIFACATSHGGLVNKFLSWSVWVPLSRLTFSAYLFHLVILLDYNYMMDHTLHLQMSTLVCF